MSEIQTTLLSNALLVVPLAVIVLAVTHFVRHPPLRWALWGLVLLKFITPAIVPLPVPVMSLPMNDAAGEVTSESHITTPEVGRDVPAQIVQAPLEVTGLRRVMDEFRPETRQPHETLTPAVIELSVAPTVPTLEPVPARAPAFEVLTNEPVAHPVSEPASTPLPWPMLLWGIWLGGILLASMIAAWRVIRFRRLLHHAVTADAQTTAMARSLANELGLRRIPEIRVCSGRVPPLLWAGLRRATVLLPGELLASLHEEGRRTLMAHELSHVARRDHWTRWLELAVRCLYWWHPVTWLAGRRLREAEEQCCDARVVSLLPDSAAAYAHTILTTVDYLSTDSRPVPTLATGLQPLRRTIRPLHRRLEMIVKDPPAPRLSWTGWLFALGLAALVLPAALIAQTQESTQPVNEAAPGGRRLVQANEPSEPIVIETGQLTQNEPQADSVLAPAAELEPVDAAGDPAYPSDPSVSNQFPQHRGGTMLQPAAAQPGWVQWRRGSRGGNAEPAPADRTKPEALTAPEDYEEITVVAREYELQVDIAAALNEFLGSLEAGFPVLVTSLQAERDQSGNPYSAYGFGGIDEGMAPSQAKLRVIAPAPVQEAIGGFLESMQRLVNESEQAETITLVRAEYSMPAQAARNFAQLVGAYQQSGLVIPMVVRAGNNKLSVTARKDVHEQIRKFVTFLGENWQASLDTGRPDGAMKDRVRSLLGMELTPLSDEEVDELKPRYHGGLKVGSVEATGLASANGVRPGDILIGLGSHEITSLQDVEWVIGRVSDVGAGLKFYIVRGGETLYGHFQLGNPPGQDIANATPIGAAIQRKQVRALDSYELWVLELMHDIAESADLKGDRAASIDAIIEDLKRREESATRDNEGFLQLLRRVFELIQKDLQLHAESDADPEEVKQARRDVIEELSNWGLRIPEKTLHKDLFGVFIDYLLLDLENLEEVRKKPDELRSSNSRSTTSQNAAALDPKANEEKSFGMTSNQPPSRRTIFTDHTEALGRAIEEGREAGGVPEAARRGMEFLDQFQFRTQYADDAIAIEEAKLLLKNLFELIAKEADLRQEKGSQSQEVRALQQEIEELLGSFGIKTGRQVRNQDYLNLFLDSSRESTNAPDSNDGFQAADATSDLNRAIAEAEIALAEEKRAYTKRLVEKGYQSATELKMADLELLKALRALEELEAGSTVDTAQNGQPIELGGATRPDEPDVGDESSSVDGWISGLEFTAPLGLRSQQAQLQILQLQKARLEEEHGTDHPEAEKLQLQIEALESQLKSQWQILHAYQVTANSASSAAADAEDLLLAPVNGASVRLKQIAELVKAAENDEKKRHVLLRQAVDEYEALYNKYRSDVVGLFARFNQALASEKLGEADEANKIYNELLALPDDGEYIAELKELVRTRFDVDSTRDR